MTDLAVLDELLDQLQPLASSTSKSSLMLKLKEAFPEIDSQLAAIAVETLFARARAVEKLGDWANKGYFSTSLLEQASRRAIAEYRAKVFAGCKHVLEIGTGTGSDTAALAAVCEHVTTIDADPVASELAGRNLRLRGITNVTFVTGTIQELLPTLGHSFDGLFADPARRTSAGVRVKDAEDYSPPLSFLLGLDIGRHRAFKISPGLFVAPPSGWVREFYGFGDECLEQTLLFGSRVADSSVCRADTQTVWSPPMEELTPQSADHLEGYLVEPHALINRSQHGSAFLAQHSIASLGHDVTYGIASTPLTPTPLMRVYRILESFPYQIKQLRSALQARNWTSRTEIKKRNFSEDVEKVRSALKLQPHSHGDPFGVIFLFRWRGKGWCILGEQVRD